MEIVITEQNFENEVLKSELPVLVDFWASWCGPCRMLAPVIERLAEQFEGKIKVGKVNVDEQMGLAMKYRVESIPTLMYFVNGEMVKKSLGYMELEEVVKEFSL